jgi:hypothetical protein
MPSHRALKTKSDYELWKRERERERERIPPALAIQLSAAEHALLRMWGG